MVTFSQAFDAVLNADEWMTELAKLRRENAELRQRLTAETMRANQAQGNYEFYMQAFTDLQNRLAHERR